MTIDLSDIELTMKLMMVSDYYEVLELRDNCEDYVNAMKYENLVDTLIVAHQLGLNDIQQMALDVISIRKLNVDKLFDGRSIPDDVWNLISSATYN